MQKAMTQAFSLPRTYEPLITAAAYATRTNRSAVVTEALRAYFEAHPDLLPEEEAA